MITKDDYIQVINQLITQPKETWKNDPFEELVKNCPKDIVEKYVTTLPEDVTPSTSEDVRTVNFDARVQYSQILGGVYLDLSSYLKSQRDKSSDEYHLVSLQDVAIIRNSFQFFLLAGIIPFLEPGVGLGAAARSTFIKSWKVYDGNKEACREKLIFAAKVIQALLSCNDAITVQFLPKFIDDVICVRFQLLELGVDEYDSEIENILEKCPIDIYFGSLMFLTQDKKGKLTPKWFKAACGRQMTKILVAKDGLSHFLQYYRERAGETWTDNLPMTKQVAWHLATVPKMFKHPLQYHEIISKQFFETIWSQNVVDKNLLAVFAGYVEELRIRFSLNCDLTVFDQILRFWEILNKKIIEEKSPNSSRVIDFAPNHVRNLQLLSQILPSADSKRIRACFTCFFACVEEIPHIKDILKASFETVGNLGYSLYQYVMTPSQPVAIVKKRAETSSKIQEIGEKEEEPFDEMWLHGIGDADQSVAMRLEKVLFIVDNILSQSLNRTILEMMSFGLEEFLKTSEKEREEDTARFVQLDSAKMFSSFHAHLLVGCCFERLINIAEKTGFSPEECLQLLQISIQILNNASAKFNRLTVRRRSVDVFSLTEEEKKEIEATRATAKMCFPIVSTILLLTQGSRGLHDYHVKAVEAMANFIKAADTFPTDDHSFNSTVEEARNLLKDLKIDISQISAPPVPSRGDKRRYSQVDICQELMEELHDDEPAVKGGTLMQIAKVFRQRSVICNRLIEYGGFEVAKELVIDDDSYVYLAAINCLCEMALFDRRLFDQLIKYYKELSSFEDKNEQLVIRLGRIAEAIGKLFAVRGEITIEIFDKMATLFMNGIQDSHEIVRASSCGAFGNMLNATRGHGIEKWTDQLLHLLTNILKVDRSTLVRRSAIDLVRQALKACGTNVFVILRERLLDIHREVNRLMKTDRDETVRLHAQLCCEELDAALRQNQEDTERGYSRKIRF